MNFLQCVTILYLPNAKNTIKIVTNMRNRINQLLNSPEWNALRSYYAQSTLFNGCANNWHATFIANLIETAQKLNIKIKEI